MEFYWTLWAEFRMETNTDYDFHGNVGIQASYGVGGEMGTSADISAALSIYPGVDSIYDLEGFGVETEGSGGPLLISSLALLLAGEGDEIDFAGIMAGVGIRTPTKFGEFHVTMSNTFPTISLGNIYTNNWNFIYR